MAPAEKAHTSNRYEPYDAQASHHKAKMPDGPPSEAAADPEERPSAHELKDADGPDVILSTTVQSLINYTLYCD